MSLRKRALDIGNISKIHLQVIYKVNRVKPFKAKLIHILEENYQAKRLDFCLWYGDQYSPNQNFPKNIMFSDESTFSTNGVVSSQNLRYWSPENPEFRVPCRNNIIKYLVWYILTFLSEI